MTSLFRRRRPIRRRCLSSLLSIKDIEKSLTCTQSEVEELKEHFEMETKEHAKEVDALNKKIADLKGKNKKLKII